MVLKVVIFPPAQGQERTRSSACYTWSEFKDWIFLLLGFKPQANNSLQTLPAQLAITKMTSKTDSNNPRNQNTTVAESSRPVPGTTMIPISSVKLNSHQMYKMDEDQEGWNQYPNITIQLGYMTEEEYEKIKFQGSKTAQAKLESTLAEDESDYEVKITEDVDFGMANSGMVDSYIGSCNTGNTEAHWHSCLDFFRINIDEYKRQMAKKAPEGQHVRVPFKKFPGMSVGLFDYQLMGVYNLIRLQLNDVSGGFLCDEQGLGKTQEMFGLIVLAHNLRRCKTEVGEFWSPKAQSSLGIKRGSTSVRHNANGAEARSCQYDQKYGFRCYCYHEQTRQIADLLPDGPNIVVAPARSCAPLVREAKIKLDTKSLKVRGYGKDIQKDDRLTLRDVSLLQATIKVKQNPAKSLPEYHYHAGAGQSDYIIFISPESIDKLNSEVSIIVKGKKKSALLPGIIMLDEFHEYALSQESRTLAWLNHLRKCTFSSQQPRPLVYFVSGTPIDKSPADIGPAITLLEKPDIWSQPVHPLFPASNSQFQDLVTTFNAHLNTQSLGKPVPPDQVKAYYTRLSDLLTPLMIRRLVTGSFLSRPLTTLSCPLKISIINHPIPPSLLPSYLALKNHLFSLVPPDTSPLTFFRSPGNRHLLLPLLISSTFPSLASHPSSSGFQFTHSEILSFPLNPILSPYRPYIPSWTSNSPKLASILSTVSAMLSDASQIPGAASSSSLKKMLLLSPHEAESHITFLCLPKLKGLRAVYVHPALGQAERQRVIDGFLKEGNGAPNLLVMSLATGGTGLNLQRASYCVITGAAWTRREVEQGFGRVWRVGQKAGKVRLELLVCEAGWAEGEVVLGGWGGGLLRGDKKKEGKEGGECGEGGEGGGGE